MSSALSRVEAGLFSPDRRTSTASLAALIVSGAILSALLIVLGGPLLALAGASAALAGALILRDLRWGLLALLAVIGLLPFAALPFQLGFRPTLLDLVLLALYFVWIVRLARRRQPSVVLSPIGVLVLLFLVLTIFAFANGLRFGLPPQTTIRNYVELVLAIGLFFLVVSTVQTKPDQELVARLILVAGAVAAGIAVIMYVIPEAWTVRVLDSLARFNYPGGYVALRYIEDSQENPMRAIGTMVDPNVLGGFLVLAAGFCAPQLVAPQPLLRRRWIVLFFLLEFLALYLTYSRGSMFGLAAGLGAIALLRYRRLLLVGLAGVAMLLLLPPAQGYVSRLFAGLQLQDRATLMRLGEYRDAVALIGRYPLFGVGFSGSPDADLYVGVSNLYLLMAEIMGIVGVAAFLAAMIGFFASLLWAWRRGVEARTEALLLGLIAAVFGVLMGGIFDHYLFNLVYPHMSALFWLYLGLGMAIVLRVRTEMPSPGIDG